MDALRQQLLEPVDRGPHADLTAWIDCFAKCPLRRQFDRALWGGFHSDRLAYAFVAGYSAALWRLFEYAARGDVLRMPGFFSHDRPLGSILSLCATEASGAHPRAIETRLEPIDDGLILNGTKTFATLATVAEDLLIVASRGVDTNGRNTLCLVRVDPRAKGVVVKPLAEMPFAPELPHGRIQLVDVIVREDDILEGDGFNQWLKPFRTIEDTFVLAATVGYLLGAAKTYSFGEALMTELVTLATALDALSLHDPLSPVTHIALAGLFVSFHRLKETLRPLWANATNEERERWFRDEPLLNVADAVRSQRTHKAWKALSTA